MNYKEIETLKHALTNMAMQGARIKNDKFNVDGKIVGVGFKPYWSNPHDTKIEKLEIDVLNNHGKVLPFNFYHVLGYDIVSQDGSELINSKDINLDIHVHTPRRNKSNDCNKVRLNITCNDQ